MSQMQNQWFHDNGYTLHYDTRLHSWVVSNADETHVLQFRYIEWAREWAENEGVIDKSKIIVMRDKREAP